MSSNSLLSLKTFGVNSDLLSALLLWSVMALFHDNHSFISMATLAQCCCFHAVPGYVCLIYGGVIGSDSAARGAS